MSDAGEHALFEAIKSADIAAIGRLSAAGADMNLCDEHGEPALFTAVDSIHFADAAGERECFKVVVRALVDLGANINALDADGANILVGPILGVNADLVGFLLGLGVDPNRGCSGEAGESVYDAASFDYRYEAWFAPSLPALDPPEGIGEDEDAYLSWLDQEAQAKEYLRPEIPMLLRQHGALTGRELATRLGGRPEQSIRWTKAGWTLAE